jgi:hypothetical protein
MLWKGFRGKDVQFQRSLINIIEIGEEYYLERIIDICVLLYVHRAKHVKNFRVQRKFCEAYLSTLQRMSLDIDTDFVVFLPLNVNKRIATQYLNSFRVIMISSKW